MTTSAARAAEPRSVLKALWLAAAILAVSLFAGDIGYAIAHGEWQSSPATLLGRDFVNVHSAGQLLLEDQLARIYDVDWYQAQQARLYGAGVDGHNYSYPPVTFLFVWLFGLIPYHAALLAWLGLTGAAFALAARPYLSDAGLPGWAAIVLPASLVNIWAGHYGFLIGALWLGGWHLLGRRPRLAGLLFGLIAIKPHMALLLPLLLAWRGAWTAFVAATLTVAGLVGASGLLFGWDLWATYLTETSRFQAALLGDTDAFYLTMMPSVVPSLTLAGAPAAAAWLVQAATAAAATALLLARLPQDGRPAGLAAAAATCLVVPYVFNYDLTVVAVAATLLLRRAAVDPPARAAAVAVFVLPLLLPVLGALGLPVGPVAIAALLWALLQPGPPGRRLPGDAWQGRPADPF